MENTNLYSAISGLTAIGSLLNTKKQNLINQTNKLDTSLLSGNMDLANVLVDPGQYTAFEVTATAQKNQQYFEVIAGCEQVGVTQGTIGSYDVDIDWGDGTSSLHTNTTLVTATTGVDNEAKWSSACTYYGYEFTTKRLSIYYYHTYETPGTYKVKITGTTYYHFRTQKSAMNLISRCLQRDLPLYSGLTRLQGSFGSALLLTKINCPSNYAWPTNLKDVNSLFANCSNLSDVGDMTLPNTVLATVRMFSNTPIKKGINIPYSVITAVRMYLNCAQLIYVPNTGLNNRDLTDFCANCTKLQMVDSSISPITVTMCEAFSNTTSLYNTPVIPSSVVWGSDQGQAWKNSGQTYDATKCLYRSFYNSGILDAPQLGTIASGIQMDGFEMFKTCKNMSSLPKIPNGVTNCKNIFRYCIDAKTCAEDTLPNTATNLYCAFQNCISLINVPTIPNTVTNLYCAFNDCKSIENLGSNVFTDDNDYPNITDMTATFEGCVNLKSINCKLPIHITTMEECFYNCKSLATIVDGVLYNMTSLVNIKKAFYGCCSLQRLYGYIPNTVTDASNAFFGCNNANILPVFKSSSVCTNAENIYNGCNKFSPTQFSVPVGLTSFSGFMKGCTNCLMNVKNLVRNYTATSLDMTNAFNGCQNLYGTQTQVEALGAKLWNNTNITFTNTENTFTGCSDMIRIYIPTTWGGLKSV